MSRLSIARRLSWGIADQAVSSLENFLIGAYVAHEVGADGLGVLALAFLAYAIATNISRALSTDPLVVRHSGTDHGAWKGHVAAASGVAFLVGCATGAVCAALGLALLAVGDRDLGLAFLVLAAGMPGLTLQDSWRYAFFCVGRGRGAFTNDAVWTVLLMAALGVEYAAGVSSVVWSIASFGLTAWLAAGFGMLQTRIVPAPAQARAWLLSTRDLGLGFVVENVALSIGSQLRSVVLAATAGLTAVGAIRGAEMLIGPVAALLMGIAQVAVPETVRALHRGERQFRRICAALSGGLAVMSILWGAVLITVFPFGPGRLALGSVWPSAHPVVIGVAASSIVGCMIVGPSAGLRALGRADLSWRCQVSTTVTYVVLGTAGALMAGAQGAAWGTCVAAALGAAVWTWTMRRATAARFAPAAPEPVAAVTG